MLSVVMLGVVAPSDIDLNLNQSLQRSRFAPHTLAQI
jgi:hypothetical protein